MQQFVRVRVTDMAGVDVGLFDFDDDATFFAFVLNHEERIYLRFGSHAGRDPTEHLTVVGMRDALERGLAVHEQWKAGELPAWTRPEARKSDSYERVAKIIAKGECVHCHQVGWAKNDELMARPDFDRLRDVWLFPDPRRLGLTLDEKLGVTVERAAGAAADAGVQPGDRITGAATSRVHTHADLRQLLDNLPLDAKTLSLELARGEERVEAKLELPPFWRVTDLQERGIGHQLEPFPGFWAKTLTPAQKEQLGLDPQGLASEVTKFWVNTPGKRAGLRVGDIVYEVNGIQTDPLAMNAMIHIRLHHDTGARIKIRARRDAEDLEFTWKLKPRAW